MTKAKLNSISPSELNNLVGHIKLDDGRVLLEVGLLSPIMVREGTAYGTLGLGEYKAEQLELPREALEQALLKHEQINRVLISLTDEVSAGGGGKKPIKQAATAKDQQQSGAQQIKKMIAVGSGKGGVGKSTTAFNLAVALADLGQKVGLLDADLYGPSVPMLSGVERPQIPAKGQNFDPPSAHGITLMSVGFLIDAAEPIAWRGPMVTNALLQMIHQVNWGALDVLIIDLPPGTGDIQLTLAQRLPLAGALIVSTPQDLALIDAKKAIGLFEKVSVPILGMVENMSLFTCPECGHETAIFGHGGAENEANASGVPLMAKLPLTLGLREASDEGIPVKLRDEALGSLYGSLAAKVTERLAQSFKKPPEIIIET